ncbi:MAG: LuxR C-terminal-related transcriptional regulator [Ilumatobacteraceae bacterium]
MREQRQWPFVGRADTVAQVHDLLQAGSHVVLYGPAGVGKTRLAAEVAATFTAQKVAVHRMVASPASSPVPLAPFASLIGSAVGTDAVHAARAALGADGKAGAGDPVLVVDDLHLLDDASATVLQQLLAGGHLRMVATLRSTAATTVGIPQAVDRLRHEAGVEHFEVAPLADTELVAMVEQALGAPLEGRGRQLLADAAGGNPMYARELVEGSLAAGVLARHGGVYSFQGDLIATPLLEEVVLARLVPLAGAHRTALELLTIGGRLPYSLVESVVGFEPLEEMERSGLLVAGADAAHRPAILDVAHPLYRELMRARLGALARMRIHRTLADADAATGVPLPERPVEEQLRSALWCVRGGVALDQELLVQIASHAIAAGDVPLATELAEEAYRSSGSAAAALTASWCAAQMGRHDDAVTFLREAMATEADPWVRSAMRLRIGEELWWTGRTAEGAAALDSAAQEPGPWTALTDAQVGVHHMLQGNLPVAYATCEPLLGHEHVWVRFVATLGFSLACIYGDRPADAITASAALLASLDGADTKLLGDPNIHLAVQLVALSHSGDLPTARAFAEAAYLETMRQPSIQARAWAAMLAGQSAELAGAVAAAARFLAEAERLWASVDVQGFATWCGAGLARAQVEHGAAEEAAETVARLRHYVRPGMTLNEHLVHIAEAWVATARGDRAAAAEALERAVERTTAGGQWTNLAETWHEAARLDLLDLLPGFEEWRRPTGALAATRYDMVAARRAGDAAELEAVSRRFEAAGSVLYAAEAAAAAAGTHRRAGAHKDAIRLDGSAGALLSRAGGASVPLLASRSSSGPLSSRETEIAELAASGLANRQIAERLIVSERTVENHLYRIFIKLGISGRDELAAALQRR